MSCKPQLCTQNRRQLTASINYISMDNLDDSENNAKISDSAYSNSCSNSQSRRSHSSKSTHSGSNSSGSSGYGGKPSAYSDNSGTPVDKKIKEKDGKKKKPVQMEKATEVLVEAEEIPEETAPPVETDVEVLTDNVMCTETPAQVKVEKGSENMDLTPDRTSLKDEVRSCLTPVFTTSNYIATSSSCVDGFSCVISMHNGVVLYTTISLTTTLGFPKDMWIGRSFIDFVHPRDRNTFASHITSGLAVPKNVNGTLEKVPSSQDSVCTMVCRIRKYRSLFAGFGVKERSVTYLPFLLKLAFKTICDDEGKVIYLVIQATPFFSAFKTPNEVVTRPVPFVIRHAANGTLEYIDPESVPYLGYLPQDLAGTDALQLYHPEDLPYLLKVYETIVKEGELSKSKSYRMMAQNGDFIRLETEWSTFINPWSRKLEFVIGKHHIIEGPSNPDVFQAVEQEKPPNVSEEEKNYVHALRESIVRIMNEVLTKPAEVAKQQMTKRCQDLASFMESLMEDQPKTEGELHLEIQDPDPYSYYERDSVMLGGISPHHDHSDGKSSTETQLSFTQLNYNDTIQRYFDSYQPNSQEDNIANGEGVLMINNFNADTGKCMSPIAHNSVDSVEMSSCESGAMVGGTSSTAPTGDYEPVKLTESLLSKHNAEMEKELMKVHRKTRSSYKEERENVSETRQKKKEHLARCNAAFQPTSVPNTFTPPTSTPQPHGVKRSSKQQDIVPGSHKHHCSAPRQSRRRHPNNATAAQTSTINTTVATQWPGGSINGMNTFILGVGIPQQMSVMSPMAAMTGQQTQGLYLSGMIPMYYAPPGAPGMPPSSDVEIDMHMHSNSNAQFQSPGILNQMQCMMYGQAVYGSPFMYSPINHQMSYPVLQSMAAQSQDHINTTTPLGLASSSYKEVCKTSLPLTPKLNAAALWREKKLKNLGVANEANLSGGSNSSSNVFNRESEALSNDSETRRDMKSMTFSSENQSRNSFNSKSTEAVPDTSQSRDSKTKNSEEAMDRTDGESSYSSFYSSFFKTESGSAEESGDAKRTADQNMNAMSTNNVYYDPPQLKKTCRKNPPWMDQVCVTSELVYKYQILTKNMDEVLQADKLKMLSLEQPSLVNEQLGQLYLDLQLEGVAARLTLEEGITSSSSSGEEASSFVSKPRKKRQYSKLVMIYEEDAPLPPTPDVVSNSAPDIPAADTHSDPSPHTLLA